MTRNLCCSLKSVFPEIPICVLTDGIFKKSQFADQIIQVDGENPFEIKSRLYDITEHIESDWFMYIDVDTVVNMPEIAKTNLEILKDSDFYIQNMGFSAPDAGYIHEAWGNIYEFAKHYEFTGRFPRYNTTVIFWKKTEETKNYFSLVKSFYSDPAPVKELIAGYFPDEVAFASASAKLEFYPKMDVVELTYFRWSSTRWNHYAFLSLAGGNQNSKVLHRYNALTLRNAKEHGVDHFKMKESFKLSHGTH